MTLVASPRNTPAAAKAGDEEGIGRQLGLVYLGAFVVIAVLVAWSTVAVLSGAVIATGFVVVENEVKTVQHPTGGIVGEIHVQNGARVKAGDLLVRLDATIARANAQILASQLIQLEMREARLLAERRGDADVAIPPKYEARADDPLVADPFREEAMFFSARRSAREGQKAQYTERIAQLEEEIVGLEAQQKARTQQRKLVGDELVGVRELYAKNLIQLPRLSQLEQQLAELDGTLGQILSSMAQSRGRIAELKLAILQLDADMRSEVSSDLRDAQSKIAELQERRRAAEDQLARLELRAPTDGIVYDLKVHTIGGVIGAGEPVMRIVPDQDALVVEAKVSPDTIDQIALDQETTIRFSAFDRQSTPELNGRVSYIAADLGRDQQTGAVYYVVRVLLNEGEAARLGDKRLIPGMPAEVHLRTGDRTVISYLLKPLSDQFSRSMRER